MGKNKINNQNRCDSLKDLGKLFNIDAPVQKIPKQIELPPIESNPASPEVFGEPFYNPYTFIPFPVKEDVVKRDKPSLLTSDERNKTLKLFTGIIDLEIKTISPLLTTESEPYDKKTLGENATHEFYHSLTINNDVIVPSTSIRGSLRTLMTILTGGTLGYLDTNQFLYQRRDTQLGPIKRGKGPKKVFLAEVIKAGDSQRGGTIRLGNVELIATKKLKELFEKNGIDFEKARPSTGKETYWVDNQVNPTVLTKSKEQPGVSFWKVKLSGRKINEKPEYKVTKNKQAVTVKKSSIDKLLKDNDIHINTRKIWINDPDETKLESVSMDFDEGHKFFVFYNKGKEYFEVKGRGTCKEGLFQADNREQISISSKLWKDYIGRNRYGDHKELIEGDLVWIEAKNENMTDIKSEGDIKSIDIKCEGDIKSIQWARWGRSGENINKHIPIHIKPDCLNDDRKVDLVTDLFGQVPMDNVDTDSFASRVRPHNLIFYDCIDKISEKVTLPPLSSPKPGCMAFYREGNPDELKNSDAGLRGYKVYRNSVECGDDAPWHFKNQGTFDVNSGRLCEDKFQKLNKTVDLINEGCLGKIRISCRSLTEKEIAHLLVAFTVDWKLGGGKPLGLGHCRVVSCKTIDENGETLFDMHSDRDSNIQLPENLKIHVEGILPRIEMYRKSQTPVQHLRYPRAVEKDENNDKKNTRGGHVWFQRHAILKQSKVGLEKMEVMKPLLDKCGSNEISAQMLPNDFETPLYGYDCFTTIGDKKNTKNIISNIEKFSEELHITGKEKTKGFHGQNKETRYQDRDDRKSRAIELDGISRDNIGGLVNKALAIEMTPDAARKWLEQINYFGITKEKSTKWKIKIEKMENIAGLR